MKKIMFSILLLALTPHLVTSQSSCAENVPATSKMVPIGLWDYNRIDGGAYLLDVGDHLEVRVLNHSEGDLHTYNPGLSYFELSDIEDRIVSGDFDGDRYQDDIAFFRRTSLGNCCMDVLVYDHISDLYNLSTNVWTSSLDPAKITGRIVAGQFKVNSVYPEIWDPSDIAAIHDNGGGSSSIYLWTFSGSPYSATVNTTWWGPQSGYDANKVTDRVVAGDFHSQSSYYDDIAAFYDYGSGQTRIHVWQHYNGTCTYQGGTGWYTFPYGYYAGQISKRVVAGDFDRDGKFDDIAAMYDYGSGAARLHVWESNGSSFSYPNGNTGYWMVTSGYTPSMVNNHLVSVSRSGFAKRSDIIGLYNYGSNTLKYHFWEAKTLPHRFDYSHIDFCSTKMSNANDDQTDNLTIEESLVINLNIFPNPTNSLTTIEIDNYDAANKNYKLVLYNSLGQLMQQINVTSSKMDVDISEYKNGIYVLSFSDGVTTSIVRISKTN